MLTLQKFQCRHNGVSKKSTQQVNTSGHPEHDFVETTCYFTSFATGN